MSSFLPSVISVYSEYTVSTFSSQILFFPSHIHDVVDSAKVDTMSLNIKNREKQRLARVRRSQKQGPAELLRIGRRCASYLQGTPADHAALLYDQKGLPQ
jgi:hypothetical protein